MNHFRNLFEHRNHDCDEVIIDAPVEQLNIPKLSEQTTFKELSKQLTECWQYLGRNCWNMVSFSIRIQILYCHWAPRIFIHDGPLELSREIEFFSGKVLRMSFSGVQSKIIRFFSDIIVRNDYWRCWTSCKIEFPQIRLEELGIILQSWCLSNGTKFDVISRLFKHHLRSNHATFYFNISKLRNKITNFNWRPEFQYKF